MLTKFVVKSYGEKSTFFERARDVIGSILVISEVNGKINQSIRTFVMLRKIFYSCLGSQNYKSLREQRMSHVFDESLTIIEANFVRTKFFI